MSTMKDIAKTFVKIFITMSVLGFIVAVLVCEDTGTSETQATTVTYGTYENPVPLGYALNSDTGVIQIVVGAVDRGPRMNGKIRTVNMFNSEPQYGNEYMAVFLVYRYSGKNSIIISDAHFNAYANNVECSKSFIVTPDNYQGFDFSTTLMPGGVASGWVFFEVPIDAPVIVSYERLIEKPYYFDAGSEIFLLDAENMRIV